MGEKELREPHLADCKHGDVLAMTTHTRAAVLAMADRLCEIAAAAGVPSYTEKPLRDAAAMLRDLVPLGVTHKHKKRGSFYTKIGEASLQSTAEISEGTPLVIYRGEDGRLWVRPRDEFEDGRFETVSIAPPEQPDRRLFCSSCDVPDRCRLYGCAGENAAEAEEIALLPCPFCGGEPKLWQKGGRSWITCRQCGGKSAALNHPDDAKKFWNRRALVQKAREEERPKWGPIETAPRDGNYILGYCGVSGAHTIFWHTRGAWYITADAPVHPKNSPTHYMPLPSPPESEG